MPNKTLTRIIKTEIKLRRDTVNNYAAHSTHIPLKGEVCIVDPTISAPWAQARNIKLKIGDGVRTWAELPYYDDDNYYVKRIYYANEKIYSDAAHTIEITPGADALYIDMHTGVLYYYDPDTAKLIANSVILPKASDTQFGVIRLYLGLGQGTDGAMSQKAVTDAIDDIYLAVDDRDTEMFYLHKPAH